MIVVDTNVIYSAFVSNRGYSFKLMEKMLEGEESFLVNYSLAMEYYKILTDPEHLRRIPLSLNEIEDLFAKLLQKGSFKDVYYLWRPNLKDTKDDFLVELAVAGRAEAIITFNRKDLVSGDMKMGLKVMTPKNYLTGGDYDSI
ncbi:MAG: putative toxin-antitoxin system toxin component, PIN family [Deltaproteobacteria bacterium]|nr:putative toxin-antitoxin system toxin component, PIN family [Deltaproteobacteria bacterium]